MLRWEHHSNKTQGRMAVASRPLDARTTQQTHIPKTRAHLYSTRPALVAATAAGRPPGATIVPSLGLGMSPRGPRMRAMRANFGIMSGVASALSNGGAPDSWMLAISSSAPTTSAPGTGRAPRHMRCMAGKQSMLMGSAALVRDLRQTLNTDNQPLCAHRLSNLHQVKGRTSNSAYFPLYKLSAAVASLYAAHICCSKMR